MENSWKGMSIVKWTNTSKPFQKGVLAIRKINVLIINLILTFH